jgi:hypothetical protein
MSTWNAVVADPLLDLAKAGPAYPRVSTVVGEADHGHCAEVRYWQGARLSPVRVPRP